MSKEKKEPTPIKILWMDDQPETIKNYKELLARENLFEIDIATSIPEAKEKLTTLEGDINADKYEALVIDCRIDPYDLTENGAEFLKQVNELDKAFPTFVYSSWAEDRRFKQFLDQSYAIFIESKTRSFDSPLSQNRFFKAIYESGRRFQEVKDLEPEKIIFSRYVEEPYKYQTEVTSHWKKHGHWITLELARRRWMWGVVCGEEIVAGSDDLFDYPDEDALAELGQAHNLIPFAYSEPALPEDSGSSASWNLHAGTNDYYPTIKIQIGDTELQDDFDTGAQQTMIAEELIKRGILDHIRAYEGEHLGLSFQYLTKQVPVTITDSAGNVQTKKLPVAIVINWDESPFTRANKKRRVLFGRDILRAFEVEVCLNSRDHITQVRLLG